MTTQPPTVGLTGDDDRSALGRAESLLAAFDANHQSLSLAGLVARTNLPRTTTYRTAEHMVRLSWLMRENGRYAIGRRLFEISSLIAFRMQLREAALPYMQDLYEATHATVHLAVRDNLDVLYAEKISGHRRATGASRVGGRLPLYCTAVGKAILAHSPQAVVDAVIDAGLVRYTKTTCTNPGQLRAELGVIRRTGLAYDHGEYEAPVHCVASPIVGPKGLAGAVSVTGTEQTTRVNSLGYAVRMAALGAARDVPDAK
ncbi:IclR family transcriptional regulator [Mycolicibacterium gadium]|uniref:IclR family transcriptional regulator n=1 Tax=Mycolicibacterium gadium TaxID=1794 RepID=A0ABT6GZA8_MYCGU|nr:IclR family transcriptional regulator [Mycolicibacterium gadium]MDG5486999.1 IclR family transcriptional regulator [Mycolicibacterium gadium]